MKKHVKVLLAVILTMVMGTETMVWAGAQSGLYDSPPAETGYWWSGYDEGQTVTMTSTLSVVYGENVELKFVMPSVGIPSGLIPTTYRDVEMELWEADTSTQSTHKIARKYNGEFEYSP